MNVYVTFIEGSLWYKVRVSPFKLFKVLKAGRLTCGDESKKLAAIKLSKGTRLVFDFVLKRSGHGLIRIDRRYKS